MFLQTYLVSRRKKALVLMPGLKDLAPSLDILVAARTRRATHDVLTAGATFAGNELMTARTWRGSGLPPIAGWFPAAQPDHGYQSCRWPVDGQAWNPTNLPHASTTLFAVTTFWPAKLALIFSL